MSSEHSVKALNEAFDQALREAIKDIRQEAAKLGTEPREADLRAVAEGRRDSLLDGSASAVEYRRTARRVPARAADAPAKAVLRGLVLLACLLTVVVACYLFGRITTEAPFLGLSSGPLGNAAIALLVLLALGVVVFLIGLVLVPVSTFEPLLPGDAEKRNQPAPRLLPNEAYLAAAGVVGGIVTLGLPILVQAAFDSWAVAAPALLVSAAVWSLAFTRDIRDWWLAWSHPITVARDKGRLKRLTKELPADLAEPIKQVLRSEVRAAVARAYSTRMSVQATASLRRVRGPSLHVSTPAERRLAIVSEGMADGTIALSGPRGVGKTELLRTFCAGKGLLSVVVVAPVNYDRREFVLHLFAEVCKRVAKDGPRWLRRQARQQLRQIWYLQSQSFDAKLTVPAVQLSLGGVRSRSRQPLTYPEIVHEFTSFLAGVSRSLGDARRLVIGIDELDRIHPPAEAQTFFNEIKVLFDVPGCLFVMSVSDEALRAADLAPVGGRTAFDSAIDEVVRVEPLDQEHAHRLLAARVIGLPMAFTALFNALARGIPRDLLRIARAAILFTDHADDDQDSTGEDGKNEARTVSEDLRMTAVRLVNRELARIITSADVPLPPEAARLAENGITPGGDELAALIEQVMEVDADLGTRFLFLDTVLAFFAALTTPTLVGKAEEDGAFSRLASAGALVGTRNEEARKELEEIRRWPAADVR